MQRFSAPAIVPMELSRLAATPSEWGGLQPDTLAALLLDQCSLWGAIFAHDAGPVREIGDFGELARNQHRITWELYRSAQQRLSMQLRLGILAATAELVQDGTGSLCSLLPFVELEPPMQTAVRLSPARASLWTSRKIQVIKRSCLPSSKHSCFSATIA